MTTELRCAGVCGYCDDDLPCPYVATKDPERAYVEKIPADERGVLVMGERRCRHPHLGCRGSCRGDYACND